MGLDAANREATTVQIQHHRLRAGGLVCVQTRLERSAITRGHVQVLHAMHSGAGHFQHIRAPGVGRSRLGGLQLIQRRVLGAGHAGEHALHGGC
jgi:hypothetical protein